MTDRSPLPRRPLEALIASWRAIAMAAGQCSLDGPVEDAEQNAAVARSLSECSNQLAALLRAADTEPAGPKDVDPYGIQDFVTFVSGACDRVMAMMRRNKFKFERFPRDMKKTPPQNDGEKWEAIAFSIYCEIVGCVSFAARAQRTLDEQPEAAPPVSARLWELAEIGARAIHRHGHRGEFDTCQRIDCALVRDLAVSPPVETPQEPQ